MSDDGKTRYRHLQPFDRVRPSDQVWRQAIGQWQVVPADWAGRVKPDAAHVRRVDSRKSVDGGGLGV